MQILKFIIKVFIITIDRKSIKTYLNQSIKFIYLILLGTCVPGDPPPGGPEDKKPPLLLEKKCSPKNGQKNFKGKKLVFVFDKEVKLNNPYEEIKIIPSLKKGKSKYGYKYKLTGNIKLTLYLDNNLQDNTVYVINFGKAISSLNGGIPNENLSVTFSTGPKIDSISVKGQVTDIMTNSPIKNTFVSLYRSDRNKTVLDGPPDYFTKTDDQGNFDIKYVKSQKYLIIASNEINFKSEKDKDLGITTLGFIEKSINIKNDIKNLKIHAVIRNIDKLIFKGTEIKNGIFKIKFNKEIKNYKLSIINKPKSFENFPKVTSIISEDKKSINIFNCFYDPILNHKQQMLEEDKKIKAIIYANDDLGNKIEKEIELHFGDDSIIKQNLKIDIIPNNSSFIENQCTIKIKTNKPIEKLDLNKIYFTDDKGNRIFINNNDIKFIKYQNDIIIKKNLSKDIGEIVNLTLKEGSIYSIDREKSNEINRVYKIKTNKNTGSIKGNLYLGLTNFIVQLLDKEYNIIKEIKDTSEYNFEKVSEGEYTIRILGLSRGRSRWYAGDIKKLEAPDPVYLYHPKNGFIKIIPGIKRKLNTFIAKIK